MELSSSPMTERQRNYRANYRYRIAGWYNGWLHVVVIYVIGFTALSIYFANVSDLRWWELGDRAGDFSCSPISSSGGFTASSCTGHRRSRRSARSTTGTR